MGTETGRDSMLLGSPSSYDQEPNTESESSGFGAKSIGLWSSIILVLNNDMGPAMILLPLIVQESGWLFMSICLVSVYLVSTFCCVMMCAATQKIAGNAQLDTRYEFCAVVKHYYGEKAHFVAQVLFNLSLQASNIAAMIIASQITDTFVQRIAGRSYALDYSDWTFIHSNHRAVDGDLWDDNPYIISLGYLVCMCISVPFGYLNLDDNMSFQWFSFVALAVFTLEFWVQFGINAEEPGLGPSLSPILTNLVGQGHVLGTVIFAYAYVITIPSWLNEKKTPVSVNKAIWIPATIGLFCKALSGLLGSWAFVLIVDRVSGKPCHDPGVGTCEYASGSENILNFLVKNTQPVFTQYCAYLWNLCTIIPGIPVISVIVRYNLINGNIASKTPAFLIAVVLPWVVTAFCYRASVLTDVCAWAGILVMGVANFVIPALLYREALIREKVATREGLLSNNNDDTEYGYEVDPSSSESLNNDHLSDKKQPTIRVLPVWVAQNVITEQTFATSIAVSFSIASIIGIAFNVYFAAEGLGVGQ